MSKDLEVREGLDLKTAAASSNRSVDLSTEHIITRTTEQNAQFDGRSLAFGNANGMHGGIYGALPEFVDRVGRPEYGQQQNGNDQYERAQQGNDYSDREHRGQEHHGHDHHGHDHHGHDHHGHDHHGHHQHGQDNGNGGTDSRTGSQPANPSNNVEDTALTDLVKTVSQDASNAGQIFGNWTSDLVQDLPSARDPKATALADLVKEVTTTASNSTQILNDWVNQLFNDLGQGRGCGGDVPPPTPQPVTPPEVPPVAPPELPPVTPPYSGGGDTPPVTPPETPPVVPVSWGGGDTPPATPPATPPEVPPVTPEVPPTTPPTQGGSDNPNDPAGIASKITNDGVSQSDVDLAIQLFNAMPQKMQDAFKQSGAKIVLQPYQGGAQGYNDGQTMVVNTGTGMFAQAFLHEAYEVVGQNTSIAGTWGDSQAVGIADKEEQAGTVDPGDLNDNVGAARGDGDWMSNVFVAEMYKRHPDLFAGDSQYMLPVATQTAQESPQLASYMDQTLFA